MTRKIRRWINILAMIFVLIPVIVLGALFAAVSLIDFNQYKPQIEQEVLAKTGHELKIDGDIDVSVIPFKFSVGESRLLHLQQFDTQSALLQFEKMNLRLSLMDLLLKQQAHLLGVEIIAPRLDLRINAEGERSWSKFLAQKPQNSGFVKVSNQAEAFDKGLSWAKDWGLKLNSLTVHEGRVVWQDAALDEHYEIQQIQLMAFDLRLDAFFTFQAQGRLIDGKRQQHTQFDIRSDVKLSDAINRLEFANWKSDFQTGQGLETTEEDLKFALNMQSLSWQRKPGLVDLKDAQIKAKNDEFSLSLEGDYQTHTWQGEMAIRQLNPRQWLDYFAFNYPQFLSDQALTRLNGNLRWSVSPQEWQAQDLDLTLDGTSLQGYVHFQAQPQTYQFDLSFGELNLDRYESKIEKAEAEQTPSQQMESDEARQSEAQTYLPIGIPVSTLRESELQGQIHIDQLQVKRVQYQNLHAGINSQYGETSIAPFDFDLYGGQWRSRMMINVNGETPAYSLKGQMMDVNSQMWLNDLLGFDQLMGNLSSRFDLTSQGSNFEAARYNLNGQFSLHLENGAYLATDLNKLLAGQASQAGDATAINQARISGEVLKGIYHLQNSRIESERFSAGLFGKVNLAQASLDNELRLRYHTPPPNLVALKDLTIPVKVKGPMAQPQWQVDLEKLLGPAALNKLMNLFK